MQKRQILKLEMIVRRQIVVAAELWVCVEKKMLPLGKNMPKIMDSYFRNQQVIGREMSTSTTQTRKDASQQDFFSLRPSNV